MNVAGNQANSSSYRYLALGMFTLTYTVNFVDRQVLSILQEPIKHDLGLSDSQLGLLTGFAFAMFYLLMGFPIASLADKSNRKRIVVSCLSIWSTMTMLCGLAANYWQLLLARMGVGIGEAGCSPPLHSMISDIFPKEERGMAFGFYNTGVNLGILIGFLLGGWINQFFGWRVALLVVGVPGLVIALIFHLVIKEPKRTCESPSQDNKPNTSYKHILTLFATHPVLRWVALASVFCGISGYGLLNWTPSFLMRSFDISPGMVGTYLALFVGVGGGVTTFAVGLLGDKLGQRGPHWYLWIAGICFALSIPALLVMFTAQSAMSAIWAFAIPGLVIQCYVAPVLAVTHAIVPSQARAMASAFLLFAINLIGLGVGPVLVGLISDMLATSYGTDSLRYALMAVVGISSFLAVFSLFKGGLNYRQTTHSTLLVRE